MPGVEQILVLPCVDSGQSFAFRYHVGSGLYMVLCTCMLADVVCRLCSVLACVSSSCMCRVSSVFRCQIYICCVSALDFYIRFCVEPISVQTLFSLLTSFVGLGLRLFCFLNAVCQWTIGGLSKQPFVGLALV